MADPRQPTLIPRPRVENTVTEPGRAVFLSHAPQDAPAAERLFNALRSASVEVWFDQSELRGGDTWDSLIRRQIKSCDLFVPIISANTQSMCVASAPAATAIHVCNDSQGP